MAMNPTRKIAMESTEAKIGRRMKKCENFMSYFAPRSTFTGIPGRTRA